MSYERGGGQMADNRGWEVGKLRIEAQRAEAIAIKVNNEPQNIRYSAVLRFSVESP